MAWLRVALGALLLTLALLCGELLVRIVNSLRRGRGKNANLDLLDRLGAALAKPKRIAAVLVIALAWFLVVWLTPPVFSAPSTTPLLEPGGLVIMSALDESPSDPRRVLIQQWNQAHPENPVQVENVPGEPDAQHAAMVANAKGRRAPAADVYLLDVVWMTEFIERGYIRPLDRTGLATDDFLPTVLHTGTDLYGHRDGLWAQAFIEFLTSAASQLILFEAGGFAPTHDSAYANATRPYKDLLRAAVVDARLRPVMPHYTDFSRAFRKGITRTLRNDGVLEPDFPRELATLANRR